MIRYQQVVFPLCTEIQLAVIAQFGFQPDGEGIIQVSTKMKKGVFDTCANFDLMNVMPPGLKQCLFFAFYELPSGIKLFLINQVRVRFWISLFKNILISVHSAY